MGKIYYSLEEAERLLPQVDGKLRKLKEMKEEISLLMKLEVKYDEYSVENDLLVLEATKKYHKRSHDFYKELEELTRLGVLVKDLDAGLIDFYSRVENKDIFLCWRQGEEKIGFWHEAHSGIEGRKPVSILKEKYSREISNFT